MTPNCYRHTSETAEDECKECRLGYCPECLVYINGPKARPMCMRCAMNRAGVRTADAPRLGWRQRRAMRTRREPAVADVAAASPVDGALPDPHPGWTSLDDSHWDVGAV